MTDDNPKAEKVKSKASKSSSLQPYPEQPENLPNILRLDQGVLPHKPDDLLTIHKQDENALNQENLDNINLSNTSLTNSGPPSNPSKNNSNQDDNSRITAPENIRGVIHEAPANLNNLEMALTINDIIKFNIHDQMYPKINVRNNTKQNNTKQSQLERSHAIRHTAH